MESRVDFEASCEKILSSLRDGEGLADRAVFAFPSNLDRKAERHEFAVIFSPKGLYRASREREGEIEFFSFSRIANARMESFLGGAACELLLDGEWMEFCRSFGSEKENISQLVRILKEVCDGVLRPEEARFVYRSSVCPTCRRPMRRGATRCPWCTEKRGAVKKLWDLIRPMRFWILLTMVLFLLNSGLSVVLPMIQRTLVDDYLTADDPVTVLSSFSQVIWVVVAMAAVRVVAVLVSMLRNVILSRVSIKTVVELRRRLYENIQRLSVAGISRHTAGDLMNRVSASTNTISAFLTQHLPSLLEQCLVIVFVAFLLFYHSPIMAVFVLLPAPFVALMYRLIWKRNKKLYHRQWVANSVSNTVLHDVFQGVREVKVYGTEKYEIEKYDKAINEQKNISVRNETAWAKVVPFSDFVIQIGHFILLYFAGNLILDQQMTIGELTMFSSLVDLIYGPLRWMANFPRIIQQAGTAISKVYEVIEEEPDVADRSNAASFPLRGKIEVEGIWFGYDENENVLENVSVSVSPGEFLGIVGRSGVGKSTLINLIMRLYDVDRGAIRIDGVDVRDISQHALRSQIGVVLQETFLFSGTVYENLAYAKPDATYDEVMEAARLANAHAFIMKLPDGYNTFVGEKGYTLSGGERQRIAIARAILHDPRILILDEATSALDTETESLIQEALARLCKDRTTIAIAHRLSTLRNATKLLVLDKKTVAEEGTHEELMAKDGGIYQSLVIAQREMNTIRRETEEKDGK